MIEGSILVPLNESSEIDHECHIWDAIAHEEV